MLAIAELAEGPWWWSQIVEVADPDELGIGDPLRIAYRRPGPDSETVPVFVPASAAGTAPPAAGPMR